FDIFIVYGAFYFDESGDDELHERMGISSTFTSAENWEGFEGDWRGVLAAFPDHEFHANDNSDVQRALNVSLALLMRKWSVISFTITLRKADYARNTDKVQRSWFGNEFAFARYVSLILCGDQVQKLNRGDVGYYVDHGGEGVDWIMERMKLIYR